MIASKSIVFVDSITDLTRQAMAWAKKRPEAFSERTGKPDIRGAYGLLRSKQKKNVSLFVQVNTGDETQKAGVHPSDAAAFVARCRDEHGLSIEGLMCIPPLDDDPVPHFQMLKRLAGELEPDVAVDGDERRLRDGDRARRDACQGRQRDLW